MKLQTAHILFLAISLFYGCRTSLVLNKLKTGDLIFVETNNQDLSGAISRVTKDNDDKISFDHIGIVEKDREEVYVLHASSKKGSVKEDLASFIRSHQDRRLVVFRLKNEFKSSIPSAIVKAKQMLGKPYNTLYILSDSSYYCSDFVQRAFAEDSIFQLKPMTFKDLRTGETDVYWKEFYDRYQVEVPEGKLGCNPNGLSNSSKIERVFVLNK